MYFLQSPIQVVGWCLYLSYFSKSFVFKVLEDKFVEIFLILPNFLSFFIVFTFLNLPYLRNVGRVRRSRRGYTFLKKRLIYCYMDDPCFAHTSWICLWSRYVMIAMICHISIVQLLSLESTIVIVIGIKNKICVEFWFLKTQLHVIIYKIFTKCQVTMAR